MPTAEDFAIENVEQFCEECLADQPEHPLLSYEIKVGAGERLEKILQEACERFELLTVSSRHRIGRLEIGDCAVWVGVSAAHRGAAFDGCRYIIDELKHRLPIWKKEHYADGHSGWINCLTPGASGK